MLSEGYCTLCDKEVVYKDRDDRLRCALCGNTDTVKGESILPSYGSSGKKGRAFGRTRFKPPKVVGQGDSPPAKKNFKPLAVVIIIVMFAYLFFGMKVGRHNIMGGGWGIFIFLLIIFKLLGKKKVKRY